MKNNQPYAGLIGKVLQHCHNNGKGLMQPKLDPTADRFFNSYISHHHPLAQGFKRKGPGGKYQKNTAVIRIGLKIA